MHTTNSFSLRSCLCFRVFRFYQAEIIVVKHLIQGRINEELGWGLNHRSCDDGSRKNEPLGHATD